MACDNFIMVNYGNLLGYIPRKLRLTRQNRRTLAILYYFH